MAVTKAIHYKASSQSDIECDLLSSTSSHSFPILTIGSVLFDSYLILKQINSERVYLVSDIKNSNSLYALKITERENIFNEEFNLRREFLNHAEFSSPHIVKLYDALEDEKYFAFTMEYVGEGDLLNYKSKTRYNKYDLVIKTLKGVGLALSEIHKKSFIHADIKPENILVGSNGILKLTDFGISRNLKYEVPNDSETKGTLKYLCPNYLTTGKLSAHSDMFSLGLVCYELIIGDIPFSHENIMVTLKNRVYEESPNLKDLDSSCPKEISDIIQKCLKINPEDRYKDADGMLKELDQFKGKICRTNTRNKIKLFGELPKLSLQKRNRTSVLIKSKAA